MRAGADRAAAAALRELPEALVLAFDADLRLILTAGRALERVRGASACREGEPLQAAFPAELWPRIEPLFASALEGETRTREVWTADERHCLTVDVGPLRLDEHGPMQQHGPGRGGVALVLETTARRTAEAVEALPRDGFEQVFDGAPVGTGLLDRDGRWLLVNRALCEITGYTSEELIGTLFDGIAHPDDALNDAEQRERLLAGEIAALQVEKRYFDAAGETVSAILSMSLVRDRDGAPLHFIAQLQDISERKALERELRGLADHDPLTGLRNRRLFEHDVRLQLARSRRYGEVAGLMVIALEPLLAVGRGDLTRTGEDILRAVARALTRRLRETDLLARLDGEEFAVLLPHIDEEGLAVVAEGIARAVPACAVEVAERILHPRAAIGFVLIDASLADAETAFRAARRALRDGAGEAPHI